ncbi:MAG: response regulator [Candidatus Omnitrophota bacterium]
MKKRILIVEDNADQRLIEKTQLEAAGYSVIEAPSAAEGIDMAIKEKPDLIIMDVRLPYKKKGIGAAKLIRSSKEASEIPIIFVTAYSTPQESKEIKGISLSVYLLKPYDSSVMLKYIKDFLKHD